jgi:hypothetical protein
VVIFVDHSRDDGFSADGPQVGHVPDGLRLYVRGPLLPRLVRPVAVVMFHVLAKHQSQVALAEDQGTVQQLAAECPDHTLAAGVLGKVVMILSPSALNTSPNAVVNSGSRS